MTYQIKPAEPGGKITEIGLASDTAFTSGNTVTLDTTAHSHVGSGRVSLSSNVVTLKAGTYIVYGSVAIDKTTNTDTYDVKFIDNATSLELTIAEGWMSAQSVTVNTSGSMLLQAHLELLSSVSFRLESTGASGTLKADGVYLMILEL